MHKLRKDSSGLTLIELLITIAVLAIVAAISIPTVTNVINNADDRSLEQVNQTVDEFLDQFAEGGTFLYSDDGDTLNGIEMPERTFLGLIDLNGDGQLSSDEVIAELTLDNKWMPINSVGNRIVTAVPNGNVYPEVSGIDENTVNVVRR